MASTIPFRDRFCCSVPDGRDAIGVGNTKFYELVKNGVIETRKIGTKTVVVVDSLRKIADGVASDSGKAA
jgi:hypothetical protein